MFFFHWTFLLLIPAVILAIWAQAKVMGAYRRWSQVRAACGMTGAQVAMDMMRRAELLAEVERGNPTAAVRAAETLRAASVEMIGGRLSDHYDPRRNVLSLSEGVYASDSIAALGIAAHETGHAIQQAVGYPAVALRTTLVPAAQIGSTLAFPLFFIGLIFVRGSTLLMDIGILLYCAAVVFTLVTLPVEFDASRRALKMLSAGGYLTEAEMPAARQVLSAAALTYVAAALMAVLQLVRLLILREERD
jgi:hypothetical protein